MDRIHSPGAIYSVFRVDCGNCSERLTLNSTHPVPARNEVIESGWAYRTRDGWICPSCAEPADPEEG